MIAAITLVVLALILYRIAGAAFKYLHRRKEEPMFRILSYVILFSTLICAGFFVAGVLYFVFKTKLLWTLFGSVAAALLAAWDLVRIARRARKSGGA
jgi:hypothetical protein